MARVLQLRRGTAAQNDNFTGLSGEVTFDTDAKTLRVHDGVMLGGYALARAGDNNSAPGDGVSGATFDINSVSDEFWAALFARMTPAPFTEMTSIEIPIGDTSYIDCAFDTDKTPLIVRADLVCKTPQAGYSIGDQTGAWGVGTHGNPAPYVFTDQNGTHVRIMTGGGAFWVSHHDTGVQTQVTNANWRIIIRIYC